MASSHATPLGPLGLGAVMLPALVVLRPASRARGEAGHVVHAAEMVEPAHVRQREGLGVGGREVGYLFGAYRAYRNR